MYRKMKNKNELEEEIVKLKDRALILEKQLSLIYGWLVDKEIIDDKKYNDQFNNFDLI
jgi:hypothetical protein